MLNSITFSTLKPLVMADIKANIVPMLLGEPGIGKSSELKHIADELGTKIFVLSVNQLGTREDLTGARAIKDEKTNTYRQIFFPHAAIQDAIDYANDHPDETPLLFLDEINRSAPDVTSACLQLITERRIGTTNLPDNIRMVAAGNDKGNVSSLDKASITRMSIYKVIPDTPSWLTVMQDKLNPYIIKVLHKHGDLLMAQPISDDNSSTDDDENNDSLFNMLEENNFDQLTVPRTIEYTSNFLTQLGFTGRMDKAEIDAYNTYVGLMSPDDENNGLMNGLKAHLGNSQLTNELYNAIADAYEVAISNNGNQNKTINNGYTQIKSLPNKVLKLIENTDSPEALYNNMLNMLQSSNDPKASFEELLLNLLYSPTILKIDNNNKVKSLLENIDTFAHEIYHIDPNDYNPKDIVSDYFKQALTTIISNGQLAQIAEQQASWAPDSPMYNWITLIQNFY